jgi:hypothetical protein
MPKRLEVFEVPCRAPSRARASLTCRLSQTATGPAVFCAFAKGFSFPDRFVTVTLYSAHRFRPRVSTNGPPGYSELSRQPVSWR